MPEQEKRVKTIEGLKEIRSHFRAMAGIASSNQARASHIESARIIDDAITMLEMQEPRMMSAAEVAARPDGKILWLEERQGVTWNLFPLEIETSSTHPDTGTDYLFFITYHDIRKFECSEYNQTWRCWTRHPTNEQREAVKWK